MDEKSKMKSDALISECGSKDDSEFEYFLKKIDKKVKDITQSRSEKEQKILCEMFIAPSNRHDVQWMESLSKSDKKHMQLMKTLEETNEKKKNHQVLSDLINQTAIDLCVEDANLELHQEITHREMIKKHMDDTSKERRELEALNSLIERTHRMKKIVDCSKTQERKREEDKRKKADLKRQKELQELSNIERENLENLKRETKIFEQQKANWQKEKEKEKQRKDRLQQKNTEMQEMMNQLEKEYKQQEKLSAEAKRGSELRRKKNEMELLLLKESLAEELEMEKEEESRLKHEIQILERKRRILESERRRLRERAVERTEQEKESEQDSVQQHQQQPYYPLYYPYAYPLYTMHQYENASMASSEGFEEKTEEKKEERKKRRMSKKNEETFWGEIERRFKNEFGEEDETEDEIESDDGEEEKEKKKNNSSEKEGKGKETEKEDSDKTEIQKELAKLSRQLFTTIMNEMRSTVEKEELKTRKSELRRIKEKNREKMLLKEEERKMERMKEKELEEKLRKSIKTSSVEDLKQYLMYGERTSQKPALPKAYRDHLATPLSRLTANTELEPSLTSFSSENRFPPTKDTVLKASSEQFISPLGQALEGYSSQRKKTSSESSYSLAANDNIFGYQKEEQAKSSSSDNFLAHLDPSSFAASHFADVFHKMDEEEQSANIEQSNCFEREKDEIASSTQAPSTRDRQIVSNEQERYASFEKGAKKFLRHSPPSSSTHNFLHTFSASPHSLVEQMRSVQGKRSSDTGWIDNSDFLKKEEEEEEEEEASAFDSFANETDSKHRINNTKRHSPSHIVSYRSTIASKEKSSDDRFYNSAQRGAIDKAKEMSSGDISREFSSETNRSKKSSTTPSSKENVSSKGTETDNSRSPRTPRQNTRMKNSKAQNLMKKV
eukprot:MONOS_14045.1-p1 / transcript=MONOS_14045.1 / gene=MONOS_14045 / organism=Monocercomonoides_exilis_PA203 / gene_product=unspecified product / transcript_product=unspecified product / location=Mono_scaffold00927:10580-13276(+) / protein_length=899 / sequence_SO=supercontig / SO=protein_coding / is_pseudo=false